MAARPVVKWAGGKSRLLFDLMERLPSGRFRTYAEPFCGGGAMFFALASAKPRPFDRALLSDKNEELVALYRAVKSEVAALIERLREYQETHLAKDPDARREHFYEVRKNDKVVGDVERGARLVFLNKTCFNGLWRVNASGRFNVPFGKYASPKILDVDTLKAASKALACAEIRGADYSQICAELRRGDFAYFDPPYVPVSKTANFTAYARDRFGWEEQEQLAAAVAKLAKKGVHAMLSNAATSELHALYRRHGFHVSTIRAARAINSDPTKRGDVEEIVATTYDASTGRRAEAPRRKGIPA
ncbi:MAG: Dam family site-specific DNA-(adenine-N6)-methyltransferase [Deltaproteobacteria bacterium]|nr:Dam family site-specific DNA-(adenine-N6)-methyltransferase [Deltaproteobacteria bacterium]